MITYFSEPNLEPNFFFFSLGLLLSKGLSRLEEGVANGVEPLLVPSPLSTAVSSDVLEIKKNYKISKISFNKIKT